MTRDEFLGRMKRDVVRFGSQKALAGELGVTEAYLSHVLAGRYQPNDLILEHYGLQERVIYVKAS